jgi:restriction endonuclease Mrr/predicted transport protein
MTFSDAAELILKRHSKGAPMHYREITQLARAEGLIESDGLTPEASMNVAIRQDVKRRELSSYDQRFRVHGRGLYSLTLATDPLGGAVEQKNQEVKAQLRRRLAELDPRLFEELIGELLAAVGYEDVEVTRYIGDGGIDVRATLTVGGLTKVPTAIQVKRWAKNVSSRTVRELRGALGPHERGLIITLSAFTRDAVADASSEIRVPISLLDGDHLLDLLMDKEIGVKRRRVTVYELDEEAFSAEAEEAAEEDEPTESQSLRRYDDRARTLWPLPGGRKAWKGSLDAMLQFVAEKAPRMVEAVEWVISNFSGVSSERVARSYWQVPRSFGLVHTDGERLALTAEGADYLKDRLADLLLQIATVKVLGIREMLQFLSERPLTPEEILDRLQSDLGLEWETDVQVGWRLGWLEVLGAITHQGNLWRLAEVDSKRQTAESAVGTQVELDSDGPLAGLSPVTAKLYQALRSRVTAIAPDVEVALRKQYVAFRLGKRTFCSVIPQKKKLRIVLPLEPPKVDHPGARDLTLIGHWGVGDLEIPLYGEEEIEQVMAWIREAAQAQ